MFLSKARGDLRVYRHSATGAPCMCFGLCDPTDAGADGTIDMAIAMAGIIDAFVEVTGSAGAGAGAIAADRGAPAAAAMLKTGPLTISDKAGEAGGAAEAAFALNTPDVGVCGL